MTGVTFTGTIKIAINNTSAAVNRVFTANGSQVTLDLPAGPYLRLEGSGVHLQLGSVLDVAGDFIFERSITADNEQVIKVAVSNISASLTAGSVSLALTDAAGLFILKAAGIAGRAAGTVSLTGVTGLTLSASMSLEFNRTGAPLSETIGTETLSFTEANYLRIDGSAVLKVSNFIDVSGLFSFEKATASGGSTVLKVGAANVHAQLGVAGSFGVVLDNASLALMLFGTGTYALSATGDVSLIGFTGLSLSGSISLRLNNTNGQVHETFDVAGQTLHLDFGASETNITRLEALGATLVTPLATLKGDFAFEKNGVTNEIFVVATGITLFVGDDRGTVSTTDDVGVRVTNATLAVLLLPGGTYAFDVSGTAEIVNVSALQFIGTLGAQKNTTGLAVNRTITVGSTTRTLNLAAGVNRFGGDNVTLHTPVADLTGSFAVELNTTAGADGVLGTADDIKEVLIGATGVQLFVGDDKGTPSTADDVGVRVSNAEVIVLLATGGYAFEASGVAQVLGVSGVQLFGMFGAQQNTFASAVNRQLVVGGVVKSLALAAGVSRFGAKDVTLQVAGQKLKGDFAFERTVVGGQTVVDITLANIYLGLGDGTTDFVSLSNGSGHLTLSGTGLTGTFGGTVAVNVPNVTFSGSFTVDVVSDNVTPANNHVRISGTAVTLTVAGQTLAGNFVMDQTTTTSGLSVVKVGVTNLSLALGNGSSTFVSVTNGSGLLIVSAQGVAASLTVSPTFNLPGVTLIGGTVNLSINTGTLPVNETLTVAGSPVTVNVPGGPYVRVEVLGAVLRIGASGGPELSGDFAFDQSTKADGTKLTRIGLTNVAVTFGGQGLKHGEGGLIITSAGIAGVLSGDLDVSGGGASAAGRLGLRINKTGAAVNETITVGTRDIEIKFGAAEGDVFSFFGSDLSFNVGDFVTIEGSVSFTSLPNYQVFGGTNLLVFLGQGPLKQANGDINSTATGLLLRNATVGLVKFTDGTVAFTATGTVEIIGINGISLSATATVRVNNSGRIVNETISIPETTQDAVVRFDTTAAVTTFTATNVSLVVAGQTFHGDLGFDKIATGPYTGALKITASNISLELGGGLLSVSNGSGTLLLTTTGIAGDLAGTVALNVPNVSAGGTFRVRINSTTQIINDAALGLVNLPAGPYLQVSGTGVYLDIAGQRLSGNFGIEQSARRLERFCASVSRTVR